MQILSLGYIFRFVRMYVRLLVAKILKINQLEHFKFNGTSPIYLLHIALHFNCEFLTFDLICEYANGDISEYIAIAIK